MTFVRKGVSDACSASLHVRPQRMIYLTCHIIALASREMMSSFTALVCSVWNCSELIIFLVIFACGFWQ